LKEKTTQNHKILSFLGCFSGKVVDRTLVTGWLQRKTKKRRKALQIQEKRLFQILWKNQWKKGRKTMF